MNNDAEKERLIKVVELMEGCKEVILIHGDKFYRLRITRRGKLILTAA
jgi:hemin uptake protein HemP